VKVGTGQNETIEGKFYLEKIYEGLEVRGMTYCSGKLYLKKSNVKQFGHLVVLDA
jgi:hypothetical protein